MAEPTKLPDIDIGRKEKNEAKTNTQAKRVAYNQGAQVEGSVTVIELKGGSPMKNAKEFVDNLAQTEADRLGRPVKVKLRQPKESGGGGGGGGGTPEGPSTQAPRAATPIVPQNTGRGPIAVDRDLSGILNYNRGMLNSVKGFVIHHTAGRGGAQEVANTLNQRGLSIQYNIDRQGNITRMMPDGSRAAHIRDAPAVGLTNGNTIGVEVSALNDADVLPVQVEAAKRLYGELAQKYPGIVGNVYGHGEINSHKQATEGSTIANAIRGAPAPKFDPKQNIPYAPPDKRTLKDYMNLEKNGGNFGDTGTGGGGGGGGGGDSQEEVIESKEAKPSGRDDDINKRSVKKDEGDSKEAKELREPPKDGKRAKKGFAGAKEKVAGFSDDSNEGTQEGSTTGNSFLQDQFNDFKGGIPREFSAQIPSMESLLMDLPQQALGQFIGQIPAPLRSLIPTGLVPGLTNNSPVSLNGLMQLVGGGALGQAAGQIIRSVAPGIDIANSATQVLQSIPITATQNVTGNAAAIAGVTSAVSRLAVNRAASGIPLSLNTFVKSIQVALNATGQGVRLPTNILGLASQIAANPLASILNLALGGLLGGLNLPILPSNLSLPNSILLSGLNQFLPPGVAQNILSIPQISSLLPGNLSNQIPRVPANFYNGNVPNAIEQNRNASPQIADSPTNPGGGGGGGAQSKPALVSGKITDGGRHIPYEMKISKYLTLGQVTKQVLVGHGYYLVPHMGYTVDQLIENLSGVATNCYDPLFENFKGARVNSGFRSNSGTDHGRGMALDISFQGSHQHLFEIAQWARDNLPFKQIILERQLTSWLHIAYDKSGAKSRFPLMTQLPGGKGENSRYTHSLVNLYGNR